ncbi:serine/threonine protein kinase Kin1p [[Candida] anglica]|uniref:non-specific serine/threonine protein kinase n=1 Tax=[Candida] anglica TaxID=148631 RepID=A0ABP0EAV9_9ASCO
MDPFDTSRVHDTSTHQSSGQPATPRMLRNVSGSLKNSRTDINLNEDAQREREKELQQQLMKGFQQQQQQQQQSQQPPAHLVPSGHSRTPSINRSPSVNAPKKKPELLPPAAINSPDVQPSQQQPQAQHQHSQQQNQPAQQFHRKSIGDWDFIKTIGAGSMGKVKLAQHNSTGEVCAVKIVPRAAKLFQRAHANDPPVLNPQAAAQRQKEFEKEVARDKRTIREAALGRLLFHPFICRLYEMVPMTNHYYMLFEYVEGGQMLDYIVSHGSLKEKNARKFVRGIASALDYCHKNSVVHRDLKIENIMINQKGDIKIIDFGLSNLYSPKTVLKTYCGSLYFAAPELLSAKPYTGPEVDIWSFGVVLYVLVCGKVPFDDKSVSVLHEKIKRGNVEYPEFLSKECVSLLSRMLVVDPLKRATLYEIIQHPWMNRGYDHVPSNYVPNRVPLQLPLDPAIIKNISSFDLGTEQAITSELTSILSSVEYQMSCENWYKMAKQGRDYNSATNAHILPDPTAGFHPLISIYFLIDEMRKRKRNKEMALREREQKQQQQQQQQQQQEQTASLPQQPLVSPSVTVQHTDSNKPPATLQSPLQLPQPVQPTTSSPLRSPERSSTPPVVALPFPEAAHTTHIDGGSGTPKNTGTAESTLPEQQPQSPRNSTTTPETLDPNSGKSSGFNSLLRRFSSKYKAPASPGKQVSSPGSSEYNFPNSTGPSPGKEDRLTPHQSNNGGRLDPMVRRGVSMKITAKEKSSGSRVNLQASPQKSTSSPKRVPPPENSATTQKNSLTPTTSPPTLGVPPTHGRASSTSATHPSNKFHGFVPVEYLPPLPNINTAAYVGNKINSHPEKKLHPTARAKSVGGHLRKESYSQRPPRIDTSNTAHHPPLPNALASQNSDEIIDAYFDDVTLDDDYHHEVPALTEDQIIEQFNRAMPNSMPSIEYPKTLFLKGFFSVQTTSTKPLPVIRYNIISVLSKLGVKFQEVKGGFICSHNASLELAAPSSDRKERWGSNEEKELYGDAFKSTSSSIEKKSSGSDSINPPRINTPPTEGLSTHKPTQSLGRQPSVNFDSRALSPDVKTHRSSNSIGGGSGHRRKFSIGQSILTSYRKKNGSQVAMPPNTPAATKVIRYSDDAEDDDDADTSRHYGGDGDSVDSMNGMLIGGGSDMLVSSRLEHRARHQHSASSASNASASGGGSLSAGGQTPISSRRPSPLKFEILVVKVPLVGLYGVQFKKVFGNTWNYKTLAGEILNDLNL